VVQIDDVGYRKYEKAQIKKLYTLVMWVTAKMKRRKWRTLY